MQYADMVWDGEGGSKSHRGRSNMTGLGVRDAPWWILPALQTRKKVWPLIEHSTPVMDAGTYNEETGEENVFSNNYAHDV